ncbi:MAG: hypothetical protein BV458_08620 [Thermoplasmata archaeon M9B2D]|nr:MAG: hypothetical protein BV458_08620 [Thermoplasmata archaeon M9B2D]
MPRTGSLKNMPVQNLFQWIEMSAKTGVLVLWKEEIEKCFCFKDGRIIFVSSRKEGERLGEFLSMSDEVAEEKMKDALLESNDLKVPFTQYLIENNVVSKEFLEVAVKELAEVIFQDLLTWTDGRFEFFDGLPDIVSQGPVFMSTSYLVFKVYKKE